MVKVGVYTAKDIADVKFGIHTTYPGVDGGPDWKGIPFDNEKDKGYFDSAMDKQPGFKELIDKLKEKGIAKGIKIFQPHLENALEKGEDVPKSALIMAMSDLLGSGIITAEEFKKEGNAEGREIKLNVAENLTNLLSPDGWSSERADVVKDIQSWFNSQITFSVFQAIRFEKIVTLLKKNGQLKDSEESGLREIFSQFVSNSLASLRRVEDAEKYLAGEIDENGNKKQAVEKPQEMDAFKYMAKRMGYKTEKGAEKSQVTN